MTLSGVLAGVAIRSGIPVLVRDPEVTGLDYDSRRLAPGFVFFAFAGSRSDGRQFAGQALEKGAVALVGESAAPADLKEVWIEVEHGRRALALAARNFYRSAAEAATLVGITGTNGKTTTAYITDSILRAAGWLA